MLKVPFETYKLANGLEVILHEDHSIPVVAVNIWYHVGSKDEKRGNTGFAHLFEHMMFQGSKHAREYFRPVQEAGGVLNGSTSCDRTNYWETVPSNFLELALWLESDRMGFLLDALDEKKFSNQREVVKNERRQTYENRPYGLAPKILCEALFPPEHPYSWLTIGTEEDLERASLEDIEQFFRTYYTSSNASLALAGDFQPDEARQLVEKYFAEIPPGPPFTRVERWLPRLTAEKRIGAEDRVQLPRLYLVWPSPPQFEADEPEMEILAYILGDGKSSRLFRSLVYEKQIAQEVSVAQFSQEIAGQFQIVATAKPGHSTAELEAAIDERIEELKLAPPTEEEIGRARNKLETFFVEQLERIGGFGGRADALNRYNVFLGDPGHIEKDIERYLRVDASGVQRAASIYLSNGRVNLSVVPLTATVPIGSGKARTEGDGRGEPLVVNAPGEDAEGKPPRPQSQAVGKVTAGDRSRQPAPAATPPFSLPKIQRKKLASMKSGLAHGLEIVLVEKHKLPVMVALLLVKAGAAADPNDQPGLATMVATMLDEGTATRSSIELASELEFIGARLEARADRDESLVVIESLKKHWPKALELFADVVQQASFPAIELERVREQQLTELLRLKDNPAALANQISLGVLYGNDSPYGHPIEGTQAFVSQVTLEQMESFYRAHYRPERAVLILVGDTTLDEAAAEVEAAFTPSLQSEALGERRGWDGPAVMPAVMSDKPADNMAGLRQPTCVYLLDKPAAAQSVLRAGHVTVPRNHPDYFPLVVMNAVLGGQFVSRLNMNLRERRGYSYGFQSRFDWLRGPSNLLAGGSVETAVTREAIQEILKEFREIRSERPISLSELDAAKAAIIRGYPRGFETPAQIASRLWEMVLFDLPEDYFESFQQRVEAVSLEDARRVARQYLDPDHLMILVVGDRNALEPKLKELNLPLKQLDTGGMIVLERQKRENGK